MEDTVIVQREDELRAPDVPQLWSVWIETNMGYWPEEDWWENGPAQPLGKALQEAAECRADNFPTKVLPEGEKPDPSAHGYHET